MLKWFYIKAFDGKEAARIARRIPRVKHDHKDAIRDVIEISNSQFLIGIKINDEDPYFKCSSKQEQERSGCINPKDIFKEEEKENYKVKRNGQYLKSKILAKVMDKEIKGKTYYD